MRAFVIAGTSCLMSACGVLVEESERDRLLDYDHDGYVDVARGGADCDDANPEVFPGAAERCDGVDDDCDGVVDGASAEGAAPWFRDGDADGVGDEESREVRCAAPGWVPEGGDCDDADPDVGVCP